MENNDFLRRNLESFDFVRNTLISQTSSDFLRMLWTHKGKARISIGNLMKRVVAFLWPGTRARTNLEQGSRTKSQNKVSEQGSEQSGLEQSDFVRGAIFFHNIQYYP